MYRIIKILFGLAYLFFIFMNIFSDTSIYISLGSVALSIVYIAYIYIYEHKQKIAAPLFKKIFYILVQTWVFGISYVLIFALLFALPRGVNDLVLTITNSKEIAMYCSSLFFLLISLFFVDSNFFIQKIVGKIKDESFFCGGIKMACETIMNTPKKTLIYIFYLLILILGQAKSTRLINIADETISQFITLNQYSIAIVISFDRIKSTWKKEMQKFDEYFD